MIILKSLLITAVISSLFAFSLRNIIGFWEMFSLSYAIQIVIAFVLITIITVPQFKTQSDEYHEQRLERKEAQIQRSIAYFFQSSKKEISRLELDSILIEKIYGLYLGH